MCSFCFFSSNSILFHPNLFSSLSPLIWYVSFLFVTKFYHLLRFFNTNIHTFFSHHYEKKTHLLWCFPNLVLLNHYLNQNVHLFHLEFFPVFIFRISKPEKVSILNTTFNTDLVSFFFQTFSVRICSIGWPISLERTNRFSKISSFKIKAISIVGHGDTIFILYYS